MNKKNGLGVKFNKNKGISLIGNWTQDNLEGLAILINESKEEKIIYFKEKIKNEIYDESEITTIKESPMYKEMKEFYSNVKS